MMWKVFKFILAIVLSLGLSSYSVEAESNTILSYDDIDYSEFNLNDWNFTLDGTGNIILNSYKGSDTSIVIPGQLSTGEQIVYNCKGFWETPVQNVKFELVNGNKVKTTNSLILGSNNLRTLDLSGIDTSTVEDMSYLLFSTNLELVNLDYIDTSNLTNMQYAFAAFSAANKILLDWDTSKVSDMSYTFVGLDESLDLTLLDTSSVTTMEGTFVQANVETLDMSLYDTSKVTNMMGLFFEARIDNLILDNFNTSNVTNMYVMFNNFQTNNLDLSSFDTSKITDMSYMFKNLQANSLNLTSFDTSNVTNMEWMFAGISDMELDLTSFDTSKVTHMSRMFLDTSNIELDLSSFNTSSVVDMSMMFEGVSATDLDLSSFDTSNVTNMDRMFAGVSITDLDLTSFDTSNVAYMNGMFSRVEVMDLDLTSFDTSNVENMDRIFDSITIDYLDLSQFNTDSILSMVDAFKNANIGVLNLGEFNLNNANNISDFFSGAEIDELILDTFNAPLATNIDYFFAEAMIADLDFNKFNFNPNASINGLFSYYPGDTIDISFLEDFNIVSLDSVFQGITIDDLDLSVLDLSNLESMNNTFQNSKINNLIIDNPNTNKLNSVYMTFNGFEGDYLYFNLNLDLSGMGLIFGSAQIDYLDFQVSKLDPKKIIFQGLDNSYINLNGVELVEESRWNLFHSNKGLLVNSTNPIVESVEFYLSHNTSLINYEAGPDAYFEDGSIVNNVDYFVIAEEDIDLINEELAVLEESFKEPIHENDNYVFMGWEPILKDENTFIGQVARTYLPIWNSAPTLTVEDYSIISNKPYDPLAYVSAYDEQEGDISHNISVLESNVNPKVVGNYQITYHIKDKDGLSDTKQVNVEVKQPLIPINQVPVIDAENVVVHVGDTYNPLTSVSASDKEDGNITDDLEVIANNVNTNKPGEYQVTYQVSDKQGAITKKTIEVYVNAKPQLAVRDIELIQGSKFDLSHVSANDHEDGDISHTINYEVVSHDIPEVDTNKVDTYHLEYSVQDSHGALVTKQAKVVVKAKPTTPDVEDPEEPKPDVEEPSEDKEDPNTGSNNNLLIYLLGLLLSLGSIYYILKRN